MIDADEQPPSVAASSSAAARPTSRTTWHVLSSTAAGVNDGVRPRSKFRSVRRSPNGSEIAPYFAMRQDKPYNPNMTKPRIGCQG